MEVDILGPRLLVQLDEYQPTKVWRGLHIHTEGYWEAWDYEQAEVLDCPETWSDELQVGDKVLIRARSGGVAGSDVSRALGGNRLVIVHYEEVLAKVVDDDA